MARIGHKNAPRKTPAEIAVIVAAIKGGLSIAQAADKYGVKRPVVYSWLKRVESGDLVLPRVSKQSVQVPVAAPAPKVRKTRVARAVEAVKQDEAVVVDEAVEEIYLNETDLNAVSAAPQQIAITSRASVTFEAKVPRRSETFTPFGVYHDVKTIVDSGEFCPVMVVGESGNGKTFSVVQACANAGRECIVVSCHNGTSDSELFGKYSLVNGNTVFERGPITVAMKRGAIVILDEVDRADTEKLIVLNAVLDGYDYTCPYTGETIQPASGFNVIATANTKLQGDSGGRYIAAGVHDEAFIERFAQTLEQSYPDPKTELKIISKVCADKGICETLVKWANMTRETYHKGGLNNFITTRRLTFIAGRNLRIYGDVTKAVAVAVARFEETDRASMLDLFRVTHIGEPEATQAE